MSRVVPLERGAPTTVEGRPMANVDFPISALMSVMGLMRNGTTYEVASVGTEGFVEIDAALESAVALRSAACLFPGNVVRLTLHDFQDALTWSRTFAVAVRRAARARVFITEQNGMCNLRHTVAQRLARWLLVAAERLRRNEFDVTHEFIAAILGVRRAGITEALAELQAAGAIGQRRGTIEVQDAAQLAKITCECYEECRTAIAESLSPVAVSER
jgi:hypothetical protein